MNENNVPESHPAERGRPGTDGFPVRTLRFMAFLLAGILLVLAGILYVMIENQKVIVANQEMMIENQNESLGYQRADEADPVTPTEAPTTMESPEPSITTTTAPPTTTTTAPPTTTTTAPPTTTTTAPPTITYVLRVTLFSEQNLRELSSYDCREVISVGGNYDDVPSATYSLVDQTNNIIGILLPEVATVNTCTFEFVGDFVSVPDLMLIRGPRMQQNGFPVRSEDFFIDEVGRVVIAELSLSVRS